MRSILENKVAYAATVCLFTAAFGWNIVHGGSSAVPGHMLLPPDPWEGVRVVAHGPIMPPDPWEGVRVVAHGPIMPPDPWEGNAASIA